MSRRRVCSLSIVVAAILLVSFVAGALAGCSPSPPASSVVAVGATVANSFAAGTLVAVPGNRFVPIESISVGDRVRSFDPSAGVWSDQRVLGTSSRESDQSYEIAVGRERLGTTSDHVFVTGYAEGYGVGITGPYTILRADSLSEGHSLLAANGLVPMGERRLIDTPRQVYSLVVERNHTYAVTRQAIAVGDGTISLSSYQVE